MVQVVEILLSWRKRNHVSYQVNNMTADGLGTGGQAGKLALARSPMRVKIWSGEWKTGQGKQNFE